MNFVTTDRDTLERGIYCQSPYIVISIRDPGRKRPRVPHTAGLLDVIYLAFHDAEPVAGFPLPEQIKLMTKGQAAQVAKFVERHREQMQGVLVHCEQGMSRSPAVAAAIAHSLGVEVEDLVNSTHPNPYVYVLVSEALRKQESKTDGTRLKTITRVRTLHKRDSGRPPTRKATP